MQPSDIKVDKLETLKNGERESVQYIVANGDRWHIVVSEAEAHAIIAGLAARGLVPTAA